MLTHWDNARLAHDLPLRHCQLPGHVSVQEYSGVWGVNWPLSDVQWEIYHAIRDAAYRQGWAA